MEHLDFDATMQQQPPRIPGPMGPSRLLLSKPVIAGGGDCCDDDGYHDADDHHDGAVSIAIVMQS